MGLLLLMGDSGSPLLDRYPAAIAYSLRRLRTAYAGSAIRVRRSSDNAEQDIGFTGAGLDTASLLSFCGAGNGFVTTWYDQAASSNAVQATAGSQPQIVSSGSLITENGRPAVKWDGSDDLLATASRTITAPTTLFIVCESNSALDDYIFDGLGANNRFGLFSNGTNNAFTWFTTSSAGAAATLNTSSKASGGNQVLISIIKNGASSEFFQNNVSIGTGTLTTDSWNALTLGARFNAVQSYLDRIQEFIVFESNQSANRAAIQQNINSFYRIF